jgi:esterase/lipase/1-acyl-sn-glycerol-3-phosphate acyltransferase
MGGLVFHSTHQIVKYLNRMIDTKVTVEGEEHLDLQSPMLFCANHFTRSETFLMPNILYQKLDMEARSLADRSLFFGALGEFLSEMGTVSTKDPHRDEIIIRDLMTAKHNWIIYPEGSMIKNKKVTKGEGRFMLHDSDGEHPVRTGAAVLALKGELEKRRFSEAQNRCDVETVAEIRSKYNLHNQDALAYRSTKIIPVTITYAPIRPGPNGLMLVAKSFLSETSDILNEELEIEGNLLLKGKMHVHFGEAIDVSHYTQMARKEFELKGEEPSDEKVIECCRHQLTTDMMDRIYSNIKINFEHLFALVLALWDGEESLDINEFKTRLYIIAKTLRRYKTIKADKDLGGDFYHILVDEVYEPFDTALTIARDQGVIDQIDDKHIYVNKEAFFNEHTFLDIRIKNTFLVIYHEVAILDQLIECVKEVLIKPRFELQKDACSYVYSYDEKTFSHDYQQFYSVFYSKPKEVGKPFLLYNPDYSSGMVLSHGYKSAPKEVEELAHFIHSLKINVYAVRLSGHGTMPEDLKDRSWQDWYDSYNRGFAALSQVSKKIYLAGFSTGGLLTLLAASNKINKVDGLICINTALRLNDIQFNYVLPTVNVLNNVLSLFNAGIEYVEGEPENPDINYSKHYLTSVGELKKLIEQTDKILDKIVAPILIIQGDHDPVVNPQSSQMIYDKVKSKHKELVFVKSKHHVMITRPEKDKVFEAIQNFLGC